MASALVKYAKKTHVSHRHEIKINVNFSGKLTLMKDKTEMVNYEVTYITIILPRKVLQRQSSDSHPVQL